jgi:hypothetical protein
VPYHETFWIVVGTAAPVIALAAVVAQVEASRAFFDYIEEAGAEDEAHLDRMTLSMTYMGQLSGYVAVGAEGLMLLFALLSLAARSDWVPLIVAEIAVPAGIFFTLLIGGLGVYVKYSRTLSKFD